MHRAWVIVVLVAGAIACTKQEVTSPVGETSSTTAPWWADSDARDPGDGGSPQNAHDPPESLRGQEVCDAWDNDRDGEVDEGTDGQPCGNNGSAGTTVCVNGTLVCRECEPGAERPRDCGCDTPATDVCNESGRWQNAACGGCEPPPPGCSSNAACVPGERRTQRCDICMPGQDCGTTCNGAVFVCTDTCEWEQASACNTFEAECDRDVVFYEACGKCGRRRVTCDGCFWQAEECLDQGVCEPGEEYRTPCFEESCQSGLIGSVRCNDQCMWEQGSTCEGCIPGTTTTRTTECVPGANCGVRVERVECRSRTVSDCNGESLTLGVPTTTVLRNDCVQNECTPGQTSTIPCTTSDGRCGTRAVSCSGTCDWDLATAGECIPRAGSCVPGTTSTRTVSCGGGYCGASQTITSTCRADGCGFSESGSGCPECQAGDSDVRNCTTTSGQCGTQSRVCSASCDWDSWTTCQARPDACTPGSSYTQNCTAACNQPGTIRYECDGCGYRAVTQCEPINAPQCQPGDEQDLGPCPLCPSVRNIKRCDVNSCTWVPTNCPVCG